MSTEDPVESLLDHWHSMLEAEPRANLDAFIDAEGSQLDHAQRARFRMRAEALAAINRGLDQVVAVSSGPLSGGISSRPDGRAPSEFTAGMEPVAGYVLDSRIGKGGFGEVWRATGPGGMPVALKIISRRGQARRTELASLENIKGVRHPHLLAVTAYWEHGDRLFIASELADGTLLGRLQQVKDGDGSGIPVDELLQYLTEAAEGIDFLNSPQATRPAMQHGDIKPQNLLLMSGSVKVGDFGLIRPLSGVEAEHDGTMTVQYASPEFLDGKLSAASDQFSLAVTYCYLRTGRLPFGGTLLEYRDSIRNGRADLSGLTPAESAVVRKALSVSPKDRFPSCSAFVSELKTALGNSGTTASRWPAVPAVFLAMCLFTLCVVGFAWFGGRQSTPSPTPRESLPGPLVIPGPRPPGPAEPSLKSLSEHEQRWQKVSDGAARDAQWVASSLILSAHAGLRGNSVEERDLIKQYWERFTKVTPPGNALAFNREINEILRPEERFFAETLDSGNYFSVGDDSPGLARPLREQLHWPKFSRLWPFNSTLRMMKYAIDAATPATRPEFEKVFRENNARLPYDFLEDILKPRRVLEVLHPDVRLSRRSKGLLPAIQAECVSLIADVVVYCKQIPKPPEDLSRGVSELAGSLLREAKAVSQEALTDPSLLPLVNKLTPIVKAIGDASANEDDRHAAASLVERFAGLAATLGKDGGDTQEAGVRSHDLFGLPVRTKKLFILWIEEGFPGISEAATEKLVQQAVADLVLSLGPETEANLLVAKGLSAFGPQPSPMKWSFENPVPCDKAGRTRLLEALKKVEEDPEAPTESSDTALKRAFAMAGPGDATIVFIRVRRPVKIAPDVVEMLGRQQPVLVFHAIVAERSPTLEALAKAHGGGVVQMRVEGNALLGEVKPTLLDLSKP